MNHPMLSIKNLNVSFRVEGQWREIIHDLSFDINQGETVSVVGESGSGKSVTALSTMQLLQPGSSKIQGSIKLDGRELVGLPDTDMQIVRGGEIGMIFQEPMTSLNPVMPVGAQVAESLIHHRNMTRKEAAAETLSLFDIVRIPDAKKRASQYPHNFSGGMRQRVMIAMALACRPKLLIADEPTTALDVTIQAQILELIRELQQEIGMSVLFITHDMGVVAEISDRVVVMLNGKKVEDAPVKQLFDSPQNSYSKMLLSAVPRLGALTGSATPRRFPKLDLNGLGPEQLNEEDNRGITLLKVEGLTTRFDMREGMLNRVKGRVHAVENISFSVRAGETLSIVGESGCGKTTAGRSLLRLVEPSAGTVVFEGRNILKANAKQLRLARQRMQMIFQDPFGSLNPRQTIGAAISEPLIVHDIVQRHEVNNRVLELLNLVGLEAEHALRFPHEFSGGQRQRVCIARSLAMNPQLIVADESVSALDATVKAQIINLMLDLQAKLKVGFLFISHDIAAVERVSHRIAVMLLGEIVEIGPRDAVLKNPQHPYTQKLIAAVPVADPHNVRERKGLISDELKSPIRPVNWVAPERIMRQVGPEHYVKED
jgi:peptide/nickel transport system ATP-binding protein